MLAAFVMLASACGAATQPDTIANAAGGSADASTGDGSVEPEGSAATTAFTTTSAAGTDSSPGSESESEIESGSEFGSGSGSGSEAEAEAQPFFDLEVLGVSMTGTGEFVRLTETRSGNQSDNSADGDGSEDADGECELGWLGYLADGKVHRYEELGQLGHTRLFNGPRGQDAIVVSCEESTERVFVQGSAVLPEDGIPRFTEFTIGQPYLLDFDAQFGWWGDLFGGYGWHGGWDELVYFDTGTGFVTEAALLLGTRTERIDSGFDVVVPEGWELATEDGVYGSVVLNPVRNGSPEGLSYVSIDPVDWAGDPEFPEGAELVDFWIDEAKLWEYVSVDRAKIVGSQERLNWRLEYNGGTLVVQHLEAGEIDLIVQYFVADDEAWLWELSQIVTDQIRHYQ